MLRVVLVNVGFNLKGKGEGETESVSMGKSFDLDGTYKPVTHAITLTLMSS